MACLIRLARFLLGVALVALVLLASHQADAAVPYSGVEWTLRTTGGGLSPGACQAQQNFFGESPAAAMSAALVNSNACQAGANGNYSYTLLGCATVTTPPQASVVCTFRGFHDWDSGFDNFSANVSSVVTCPPNSVVAGGSCICVAPAVENLDHTQCIITDPVADLCEASKGMTFWVTMKGAPGIGTQSCLPDNCLVKWASVVQYKSKATGLTESEGNATYTGASCTYSSSSPAAATLDDGCKGGQGGLFQGVPTCIPYSPDLNVIKSISAGSVTSTVTVSSPSGTGTTSTTTVGTTGTGKEVTCDSGACSVTTTVVRSNPDGTTKTEATTETLPVEEFCKTNPTSAMCKPEGTWAGSCGAAFTCTGDAVMCAAARAVNESNCKFFKEVSPEKTLYDSIAAGNTTATGIVSTVVALSPASFDQTNALGVAGQCIPDLVVTVWAKSVTLPISQVCPQLAIAGQLLMAISFLLAIRIVGRG